MQCFQHRDAAALGVCRTCGRGVCATCLREGEEGITCSEACQSLAKSLHEMNLKAMRIYRIGEKPQRVSVGLIAWLFPGVVFFGFAAVSAWRAGHVDSADAFAFALGSALIFIGGWLHWQQVKLNRKQ